MKPRGPGMHNIQRLDNARDGHGYRVTIERQGQVHQTFFPFEACLRPAAALRAAKQHRDAELARLPQRQHTARKMPGYGYVREGQVTSRGNSCDAFVAWLRIEDMRCKQTSYGIDAHGPVAAERAAYDWLERERRALAQRLGISFGALMAAVNAPLSKPPAPPAKRPPPAAPAQPRGARPRPAAPGRDRARSAPGARGPRARRAAR